MNTTIRKLIKTTFFLLPVAVSGASTHLMNNYGFKKDTFNCASQCVRERCEDDVEVAYACVAWCVPANHDSCWAGALHTIKTYDNDSVEKDNASDGFREIFRGLSDENKETLTKLLSFAQEISKGDKTHTVALENLKTSSAMKSLEKELLAYIQEHKRRFAAVLGSALGMQ